jgi:hypothetical protein
MARDCDRPTALLDALQSHHGSDHTAHRRRQKDLPLPLSEVGHVKRSWTATSLLRTSALRSRAEPVADLLPGIAHTPLGGALVRTGRSSIRGTLGSASRVPPTAGKSARRRRCSWLTRSGSQQPCGPSSPRGRGLLITPVAAVRAVPARLLLSCLLFRSSWLTVESDRHSGAAGVLRRRDGRAAVAVGVGVARRVPERARATRRGSGLLRCRRQAGALGRPVGPALAAARRPKRHGRLHFSIGRSKRESRNAFAQPARAGISR